MGYALIMVHPLFAAILVFEQFTVTIMIPMTHTVFPIINAPGA